VRRHQEVEPGIRYPKRGSAGSRGAAAVCSRWVVAGGWCGFGEEAAWSSTEWRAGLLRTADGGRGKVVGGGVACYV
jgi:hypothetical protein